MIKGIYIVVLFVFLAGCSLNKLETPLNSTRLEFYNNEIVVEETPDIWRYKNSPIEKPFFGIIKDRNITIVGTFIFKEEFGDYAKGELNILGSGDMDKTLKFGKWRVFSCETNSSKIRGDIIVNKEDLIVSKRYINIKKQCLYVDTNIQNNIKGRNE